MRRLILRGPATVEEIDRAGEICDYQSTKPYFSAWFADRPRPLCAMHRRRPIGELIDLAFDDDAKRIIVTAQVLDLDEWRQVNRFYKGFSQGGRYIRRWVDDAGLTRFTADPQEISLVDVPAVASAVFW